MSALWDILSLLSSSPGALIYYLILLFCIWAIVGLALSRWSRGERGGLVARLLLAGALMSCSRFVLVLVALLSRQGDLTLVRFAPPLERLVDALAALLVCWAFVFPQRYRIAGLVILGSLALLTLALYALSAVSWIGILDASPLATYNGSTVQSRIWELWQLGFLIPAFVYTLVSPDRERDALNVGLGVLVAGHLLQLVYPLAGQVDHVAAWIRFANLIAFPLYGVAAYQFVIQRFDAQMADVKALNQGSLAQMAGLMGVLDTDLQVFASLEWDTVLQKSVQAVSQVLQSDLCALLLPVSPAADRSPDDVEPISEGDARSGEPILQDVPGLQSPAELELVLVYDTPRFIDGNQRISVAKYPVLQRALTQSGPLVSKPGALGSPEPVHVPEEWDPLYRLVGCDPGCSLLVQSLDHPSTVVGVLLACRTLDQAPFTASDGRKSEMLAAHLGAAIANARRYQKVQSRLGELSAELEAVETRHTRLRADLENRLTRTEEQATLYMQRLYEAELGEQQAQEDAQQARRKLAALRQENQAEVVHARDELKQSIQQITLLTQQMANLDAQCLQLGKLVQALEQEKGLLQLRLAVVATEQADPDSGSISQPAEATRSTGLDGLAEATSLADELVAGLAQDLGVPLASLLEYAELLANSMAGRLEYRQSEFLKRVQVSAERLRGMLSNLTSLIEMDGDAGNLAHAPVLKPAQAASRHVDVAKAIEVALARVKFRLEEKDLQTRLEIGVLPTLQVDPARMQQIVDNMVSYAWRSARSGTAMSIRAYTHAQGSDAHQLHIAISTTGGTRSFDRRESQVELLIVRALVRAHQGQIEIEDAPGGDTAFHLTMPVDPVRASEGRGDGRG